jgi:crotonobetainyl-CoA:carnitine CoA-transferase CaiB-like acyl-CoA transferase
VASYEDVAAHPQVAANGMLAEVRHARHGAIRMPGFPVNSAQANAEPHRAAPACGQDTRQVLRESGFSDEDIAALQQSRAVHCAAPADSAWCPAQPRG